VVEADEDCAEVGEGEEEVVEVMDYNLDQHVLRHIKEKENGKKQSSQVWTSSSLSVLLKARDRARRRRTAWEAWAVEKHGSLQAAFSNPRVKAPKLEDLLVEEWDRMKPNQTGISAWTLKSYINKFEVLKQDLVDVQQQEKRRLEVLESPVQVPDCFPASDIPRFDLEKLDKMKKLPVDVVDLVKTRQWAKVIEVEQGSKLDYLELWRREYKKAVPNFRGSGHNLQARLFELQCIPLIRKRLKSAMLTKISTIQDGAGSHVRAEEFPTLLPRVTLFPEVDDYNVETNIRRPTFESDRKIPVITFTDHIVLNRGVGNLRVPEISFPKAQYASALSRHSSKVSYVTNPVLSLKIGSGCDCEIFECPQCDAMFDNYNNYHSHKMQHQEIVVHAPAAGVSAQLRWSGYTNHRDHINQTINDQSEPTQLNQSEADAICRGLVKQIISKVLDGS